MRSSTVSLKTYSSLRIGGEGEMITVTTIIELVEVLMYAKQTGKRVHVIGEGTNTFFGDDLSELLFIKMEIKGISLEEHGNGECIMTAYAGEHWDDFVNMSVKNNLWGIENLSAIPGTVGAAPVQNIGAYGVELRDVLLSVTAVDSTTLDVVEISNEACLFGYRDSRFKQEKGKYIIVSVTVALTSQVRPVLTYAPLDALVEASTSSHNGSISSHESTDTRSVIQKSITAQEVRDLVIATRKAKLPDWREYPNAGSFFKNPIVSKAHAEALRARYPGIPLITHSNGYKIPAAWLIEHIACMKGVRVGDVGTWPNHPLVIVNYGSASHRELIDFSDRIINIIKEKTTVLLEREAQSVL